MESTSQFILLEANTDWKISVFWRKDSGETLVIFLELQIVGLICRVKNPAISSKCEASVAVH